MTFKGNMTGVVYPNILIYNSIPNSLIIDGTNFGINPLKQQMF